MFQYNNQHGDMQICTNDTIAYLIYVKRTGRNVKIMHLKPFEYLIYEKVI